MNVGQGDLGVMKELLEEGRKGKIEPRVELILGKINDVVSGLLCRHWIRLH